MESITRELLFSNLNMTGILIDEEFVNKMLLGDPRCTYGIGDKVRKGVCEESDITPLDTPGTVVGSYFDEMQGEAYLVEFDNRPGYPVFIVGSKIKHYYE